MIRPILKPGFTAVDGDTGVVRLARARGAAVSIGDPDGFVRALLDLADGTRTVADLATDLAPRRPELSAPELNAVLATLDAAGLLEDFAASPLLARVQQERHACNLAFLSTFAGLDVSRHELHRRLTDAHVLLLGVGGLGSSLLLHLAGLGVGRITALDCGRVELRDLSRQCLYTEVDIGLPKLDRAIARARAFNPAVRLTAVAGRVDGPQRVAALLGDVDLVLCAIDRSDVRSWVNEASVGARVPFVTGGMQAAHGWYCSVDPATSGCLACAHGAHEEAALGAMLAAPGRDGVQCGIGPAASLLAGLVGMEAMRYLTGFSPPVAAARLWLSDFITGALVDGGEWPRRLDCPVCGSVASTRARA